MEIMSTGSICPHTLICGKENDGAYFPDSVGRDKKDRNSQSGCSKHCIDRTKIYQLGQSRRMPASFLDGMHI